MAAPKENLLSLGQLTVAERNTFTKRENGAKNRPTLLKADLSTLQSHQHLRVTYLQQRWQELKERELAAQQRNRELLQQFERAQDTLRKMVAHNAAMKTIRMEYERYLEESSPHWQQQLREKVQAARRTRMEDSSGLHIEDHVTQSSSDLHLQGPTKTPQKVTEPQEHNNQNSHSGYNQVGSSHLPYMPFTWLTHPPSQAARFPIRAPFHLQGSSHVHPLFLQHPDPFHHLASMPSHHQPWSRRDAPSWASLQTDLPLSWTAGATRLHPGSEALWGQLYTEEPLPESRVLQVPREDAETSRAPSSKSERDGGSRSSHLSQELDIKPVRLSSGHAESSESGRDSTHVIKDKRKKREKRGRSQGISSERERHSSQESSRTSSAIIIASAAVVQSSESDASSEKHSSSGSRRTKRKNGGRAKESPSKEKVEKGCGNQKEAGWCTGEESSRQTEESMSEKAGNQSPDEKSESSAEESGGTQDVAGDEIQQQQNSSPEQSSAEEKNEGEEKDARDGEEDNSVKREKSQKDEQDVEDEEDDDPGENENSLKEAEQEEDDEASARKNTTEDETGAEDGLEEQEYEEKNGTKKEESEKKRPSSVSSQEEVDEVEGESDADKTEDEEGEEEEEQTSDKAGEPEEESDSEDSIISPQDKSKKLHVILEEAAEDEKGSETGSDDDDGDDANDFSDEDVIENLLAPQEPTKKEEQDLQAAEAPKAICDTVRIFQVEDRSTKAGHQSDSDEFDHFYD